MERLKKAIEKAKAEQKTSELEVTPSQNELEVYPEQEVKLSSEKTQPMVSRDTAKVQDSWTYRETRVEPVSQETLRQNRVIAGDKSDARSNPFHMLRTQVLQKMRDNGWRTLAISAPTPKAGKSLVSVNLAISIAMDVNQTVLLVDMDLRRPSIHKYFSISPSEGVQDYVNGKHDLPKMLINPGIDRLVLLPGGNSTLHSAELLSTPQIADLVKELRERYESRIIIFDMPPMLVADDVMVFLPYVDCSLLVVEEGSNTKEEIQKSLFMLENFPLIGTVLNKAEEASQNLVYYQD